MVKKKMPVASNGTARLEWALPFRELRKTLGFSQAQMATALGVSQGQVAKWEGAQQTPTPDLFRRIARIAPEGESGFWLKLAGPLEVERVAATRDTLSIPLLRDAAAAGTPRAVEEREVLQRFDMPKSWFPGAGKLYAVRIAGESMAPVLLDGHIAIIDITRRAPEDLVRHMVAARDDDGITLKWLRRTGSIYSLVPQNTSQDFDVQYLKPHGPFELVGEVVMWIGMPPKPRK